MTTADWFAPAVAAEPLPAHRPRRKQGAAAKQPAKQAAQQPARRPQTRRRANLRVTGGIVWMSLFALLLVGVVALNVAVLRANMAVHRLDDQRAQLQAQNQALASQLSAAGAAPRIEKAAHKLGLVLAPSQDTSYLDLGRK